MFDSSLDFYLGWASQIINSKGSILIFDNDIRTIEQIS